MKAQSILNYYNFGRGYHKAMLIVGKSQIGRKIQATYTVKGKTLQGYMFQLNYHEKIWNTEVSLSEQIDCDIKTYGDDFLFNFTARGYNIKQLDSMNEIEFYKFDIDLKTHQLILLFRLKEK